MLALSPCPRCGAQALPGNAFCHRCRARLQPAAQAGPDTPPLPSRSGDRPSPRRWLAWGILICVFAVAALAGGLGLADRQRRLVAAREAAALRDLRALVVAELRYSQSNGGHYDRVECLAAPSRCIPRYPTCGHAFIDAAAFSEEIRGEYRFVFHSGPPPARGVVDERRISATSMAAFAYVATPAKAGANLRSFCADASGRLCVLRSSEARDLSQGVCPLSCVDLR